MMLDVEGPSSAVASNRRQRALRLVCGCIVALSVVEFLVATVGYQILRLPPSTDFATYYIAGEMARAHESPYDAAALAARGYAHGFTYDQFPFLYPPPFALAMQPLTHLSYPRARQVWMLLDTVALLGALAVTARLVRRFARRLGVVHPSLPWLVFTAFVPMALNSTSVHNDIRNGSVGILLYLALVLAAWALFARRSTCAGVALAAASWLKLAPVVLIAWAWWRGGRRAATIAAALLLLSVGASVMHWGGGILPAYVRDALLPYGRAELPRPMNQSVDAVLSRILVANSDVGAFADLPRLKLVLSAALTLAIFLASVRTLRRPHHSALLPIECSMVTLALLALMKITWVQTLAAMLFVWPVTWIAIVRAAERGATWAVGAGVWAAAGFFLAAAHFPILWPGWRHGPQSLVLNLHCVGVLILWQVTRVVLAHASEVVDASATDVRVG